MELQPASDVRELAKKNNDRYLAKLAIDFDEIRSMCDFINNDGREIVETRRVRLRSLYVDQKALTEEQVEHRALYESVASLRVEAEELENGITELREIRERQEHLFSTQSTELDRRLEAEERKNDHLIDGVGWYSSNLGYRVEPNKNNGLRIVLSKVLPTDPNQEFSFSIRHDKQKNLYSMLECNPQISCSKALLEELNHSKSVKKFLSSMRHAFRAEFGK